MLVRAGLLRQRDFRLFLIGETVSGTGTTMATVVVPLLAVTVLHAGTFQVAALTAAGYLPALVIGLPAGAWADRSRPRPLMIACDLLAAALYASLPAAAWLGVLTVTQLLAVALLAGSASVLFTTAYQILLPSLVTPAELAEANAKMQGSAALSAVAGRSTAGLAAGAFGAAASVLFNAASFLVSAGCLLRIRGSADSAEGSGRRRGTSTIWREMAQGAGFIAHDPRLRLLTIYGALANLAYTGSTALVVVFLVRTAGLSGPEAGLLLGFSGVGGLAGALVARPFLRRFGTVTAMRLGAAVAGACGLMIPLAGPGPRAAWFAAGSAAVAAWIVTANVIIGTFRQTHCPRELLGRVVASMRFVVTGTIPAGALAAGALGAALGARAALWAVLGCYALSSLVLFALPRDGGELVSAAGTSAR